MSAREKAGVKRRPGSLTVMSAERRPDLQGMRAVAVLAVFADHLFGWPSGGFVGVDIFFVLSGFFITGLLIRERAATGTLSFEKFYVRRVKRILPSAMLVLAVTVVASYLLFPATRAKDTFVDALYAAVFAANFRFESLGADYFQQDQPPSPIQHFWSLSIEEQFYFVWPSVIVLIFALTRQARRRGKEWARQAGLFGAMAVVVLASFVWAMLLSANDANRAYFSTFTRIWELGIGALVAIAAPWLLKLPDSLRPILAYLGLAGVVCSLFVINSTVQFPAPWAALPVLSTALIVASFSGSPVRGMPLLTNSAARYFGDTSYTLYLWHWPVIILLLTVMAKGPVFYVLALVLSLGLTAITYRYYENPIRHSGWLSPRSENKPSNENRRLPSLAPSHWGFVGGAAAALAVVLILTTSYNDKIASMRAEALEAAGSTTQNGEESPAGKFADPVDPCFGAPAMVTKGCVLWDPDKPVQPSIDQLRADSLSSFECFREEGKALKSCTYGYAGMGAQRVAIVGDSHAAAILPGIWPSLEQNKWQLTAFTGYGCRFDGYNDDCRAAMAEAQAKLLEKPFDLLLLTGTRKWGGNLEMLQSALAPIVAAGTRIAFISDTPLVSAESMACLTRANTGIGALGDCGTSRADGLGKPDPMVAAAGLVAGSTLIDLTKYYCDADRCPSVIGNVPAYFDEGAHLTRTFAQTLAPTIRDGMRKALPVKGTAGSETQQSEPGLPSPPPTALAPPAAEPGR
jgi:peptidoglycan/LPS O-acetylase OafA/YrhL